MSDLNPKMFYRALLNPYEYCSPNINTFLQGPIWWYSGRIGEYQTWMADSTNHTDDEWAEVIRQNRWRSTSSGGCGLDMDFLAAVKPYVIKNT